MSSETRILDNDEELAREAAELFLWLGQQAMAARGRFRVALSGGTTPKKLYAALIHGPGRADLDWSRTEFYFGDERCVPPDHRDSNFGMAEQALFQPLSIPSDRIYRMPADTKSPDAAARQYEMLLRDRFAVPAPAWPRFDLILLGLGEDGHTASLFPGTQALEERTRLVVVGTAPKEPATRLTLTVPTINQARTVMFLVSGSAKAGVVRAVVESGAQEASRYPAKMIRPEDGRLIWLLDRAAGSALTTIKQQLVSHEE